MTRSAAVLFLALMIILGGSTQAQQGNFTFVLDINTGSGAQDYPRQIPRAIINPTTFLTSVAGANDVYRQYAVSASLTAAPLKPGLLGYITHNSVVDGKAYFQGETVQYQGQPWISDGTAANTTQLISVRASCGNLSIVLATKSNGINYLVISAVKCNGGSIGGYEATLYKTNGTTSGTVKLKGWSTNSGATGVWDIRPVGSSLSLFKMKNGYSPTSLMKTDGTSKGTVEVKSFTDMTGTDAAASLGGVYFTAANDGVYGSELWRSNGTAGGTVRCSDINPNSGSSSPNFFTVMNSKLYFTATNGSTEGLYCYDPSQPNAVPAISMNGGTAPKWLTVMGGRLYYSAFKDGEGRELWVYDPGQAQSIANPAMIDIYPGSASGDPRYGEGQNPAMQDHDHFFAQLNNTLYFAAKNASSGGYRVFRYSPAGGVALVTDHLANPSPETPNSFTILGGKVFFLATDPTVGNSLFAYDPNYIPPSPKLYNASASPQGVVLAQNHPNPFNPSTTISYTLPEAADVTLVVTDALGRTVARLCSGERRAAGTHSVTFDALHLPSGLYLSRLEAAGAVLVRKMLLLR